VKLPRDLSGWKIINALKRLGFTPDNQHGSHIRLTKDRLKVTVPNHRAILPKTPRSILRQAEITIDELMSVIYKVGSKVDGVMSRCFEFRC